MFTCPTCGGDCEYERGKGYKCKYCGGIHASNENSDEVNALLSEANAKRIEDYDFEKAWELCERVLQKEPNNQAALWCAMLAQYQIVDLPNKRGVYKPTFLNPDVSTPLDRCGYYQKLSIERKHDADKIEAIRREVVQESKCIPNYDVFISYRQHENDGRTETPEATWAAEVYRLLTKQTGKKSLRVFYDKAVLDERNEGWEPHIYAALRSAKFMVLIGSSIDNLNTQWVKNEWKRFLAYRKMGQEKTVALAGYNLDPAVLPDEALAAKQILDVQGKDWKKKLLKRAHDACNTNKDEQYLLKEAENFMRKKQFSRARKSYSRIADGVNPRNAYAHWGLLKCRLKAFDDYDLVKSKKDWTTYKECKNALDYSKDDHALQERFQKVLNAHITHSTYGFERNNYNAWRYGSKTKRIVMRVTAGILAALIVAFGIYSAVDITHPVKYEIDGDSAVLTGKSLYCNLVLDDLDVRTYKDIPVVRIADGAMKGAALKTLALGETVREIGAEAFADNKKLRSVSMENAAVKIGERAFSDNVSLADVRIGEKEFTVDKTQIRDETARAVTGVEIGAYAFENCIALKKLGILDCAYVGAGAFSGCFDLKELYLDITDGSTIDEKAFDNMAQDGKIFVPTIADRIVTKFRDLYTDRAFVTYTRDRIEECEYFIDRLSTIRAWAPCSIFTTARCGT